MKKIFVAALAVATVFGMSGTGFALQEIPADMRSELALQRIGDPQGPRFVEGQILLQMKQGFPPQASAPFVQGHVLRTVFDNVFLLDVGIGRVQTAVEALRRLPEVAAAEPNWLRRIHQGPDDAGYGLKWDLNNDGYFGYSTADADIDWQEVFEALNGSCGSGSAVLAIIDSGIDPDHPDLADHIDFGAAMGFIPHDLYALPDDDPTDENGHGTHVAGISRAATNNLIGTAGVGFCENIVILPLRVCDFYGMCPDDAILSAIDYAIANGADVINMSLGGPDPNPLFEAAINDAWDAGLVFVASAGNDGTLGMSYPAAYANAIAVGSTNWHDTRAAYSNYGPDLDVVAPGGELITYWDEGIYSTIPTYLVYLHLIGYLEDPPGYMWLEGTSMAAPQVSGLAALLFALDPTLTNADVRGIIETTADDLGTPGFDSFYGHGRINAYQAYLALSGGGPPPPPPEEGPPAAPSNLTATTGGGGKGKNVEPPFVDLAWSDNSGNENYFEIERCEVITTGKGKDKVETCDFGFLNTVDADVATYQDTGIGDGTYRYRVQAVNDFGPSAWSNEAEPGGGGGGGKGPPNK